MAWDAVKNSLLEELAQRIDKRGDAAHRTSLHNLAGAFLGRFPAEDMRGRSVENLYGCLYGLLRFMDNWDAPQPKVRIFNPEIQGHGWESKYTVVAVLCRDMPFCTASVRGELNQRNIRIHALASCNLVTRRDANNGLQAVLDDDGADGDSHESLLYFEIGRHSQPEELEELRHTLEAVLGEVALVVDDFRAMRQRLDEATDVIANTGCVDDDYRAEAIAFCQWLRQDHMTFLGYEYLSVQREGAQVEAQVDEDASLGLLRKRSTRGPQDLIADINAMPPDELQRRQLSFSKSRLRSRVHRLAYPDYVEIKVFDERGELVGQHRFIGLFTSTVYTMNPSLIPILRRKVEQVIELSGLDFSEHDGRELERVLELFPRDELFQSSIRELFDTVMAVNRIQERRQTRLFVRKDVHGKFVNCLVYMPRDRYTTERRVLMQDILTRAFGAEESEFTTHFSESILVRCHFVLRVNPADARTYDVNEIEEQIVQATLAWEDRLRMRLVEEFGEESGEQHARNLGVGFPPGYRDDFDPRVAVMDIHRILSLQSGDELAMRLYRLLEEGDQKLRLRIYHRGDSLPLSDILPILENLGLRVVSERPYGVRAADGQTFWIQEFSLIYSLANDIDLEQVRDEFEDAFSRIWFGEAENDSFNRLLLGTRLSWREIALLRAYARYLRQLQFPYSVDYIAETMANHLHITAGVVELFLTRFSPVFDGDEDWRAQREAAVEQRILDSLEQVQNLGEDRIVRQFVTVIKATLRTNFFQEAERGVLKPYFSFKFDPRSIPEVPAPVPVYEIFVYSPRVEGVHLRGGKVARGGLRWSDRLEDFRTEVLGLVKAQQVKNAVIVPVGAKGGFVAKNLTPDMGRDEIQQEGVECYKLFIRGLLDITDNRTESGIQRPPQVVAKDEEDPYLVVAADKGTATFSDIANDLADEYGFWLGDAFASGGSAGYDHKKMGITARGAWVSVERHFREMGINPALDEFTAIGIGDMGGDVFGNGLLCSEKTRLVAAFNHIHIFIDPNPDAEKSYRERKRLFEMPRSSWTDYDTKLISKGGGVFSRSAKSIPVSAEMKKLLGIKSDRVPPNMLISHILKAQVDLLWFGGIGTYVKAQVESHGDVGDKANDGLRINGSELRCKVVGEGGNLGMTQLGRIEFALNGGRLNTDFIDNSGGVDCSDHEVNMKILLNRAVAMGDLTGKQRNVMLEDMTDDVAELVLKNNYRQTQAISIASVDATVRMEEYRRLMNTLESEGKLNRSLEFLPEDETLSERKLDKKGLTRPELSVLISYVKGDLKQTLIDSSLPDEPLLAGEMYKVFPQALTRKFSAELGEHQLRREIIATQIANDMVNHMGITFVERLSQSTGADPASIALAWIIARDVFRLDTWWDKIEALDFHVPAALQMELMNDLMRLIRRSVRWLLRNRRAELNIQQHMERFADSVWKMTADLPDYLGEQARAHWDKRFNELAEAGLPKDLASVLAGTSYLYSSLGIIEAREATGMPLKTVANLYYDLGEKLDLSWFANAIAALVPASHWQALARESFREDLDWQQRALTTGVLKLAGKPEDVPASVESWMASHEPMISRWKTMLTELKGVREPEYAMFSVALRELLDLAQSTMHSSHADAEPEHR